MKLTREQEQQVLELVRQHGIQCSTCGSEEFIVGEPMVPLHGDRIIVPLGCKNKDGFGVMVPVVEQDGKLVDAPVIEH